MKKTIIALIIFLGFACELNQKKDEKDVLEQKVEAFIFLSDYHHQLHIMIGEEEGDILKAYNEFKSAPVLQTNIELIPVKEALERIKVVKPENIDMKQLDYLVDYYQSGLSIQIEAILRGYGYKENFENNSIVDVYDKSSKGNN